ncbi:MAG: PAS domain S-box protein [Chromatiaceae bacterium]|nr:PAS domain S-box protein [Chromatiaceae bacterium]MCF7996446.1 PAS domain S-box protein [Chromatiaceae bacterium]
MSDPSDHDSLPLGYQQLLNGIPSTVLLVSESLRICAVNQHFLEKSRRRERDTIGRQITEVFPRVILERTDLQANIEQVFRSGQPMRGEQMSYRAPGISRRVYFYSIVPLSCENGSKRVMLFVEDVSERARLSEEVRRVERRLASVVESASDIVLSTDNEGRIRTWNTAAETLSGLSAADVSGRWFAQLCAEEDIDEASRVLAQIQAGSQSQRAEWRLTTVAGQSLLVSWVFSAMRDDYGEMIGMVAVGRDLTERRELEMHLRQSQKLAALGVMAGGIAHEIRNPLSTCYSAVQFLDDPDLDEDLRRECIDKIKASVEKASGIIENLLRFARPSADDEMQETDLCAVLKDTTELVANQVKVQQISLTLSLEVPHLQLRAIPNLLQQVFLNLLLNAINAMPDGGELRVELRQVQNLALVDVTDTGIGIPSSELQKIFDPFHTSRQTPNGTGLGLSICYSIIQRHLGSISVTSRVGEGSIFRVQLPIL